MPLSPRPLTALRLLPVDAAVDVSLPGPERGWRPDEPLMAKVIWDAVRCAAQNAGIDKHVSPHTLSIHAQG
jgi:integrase/recombinase XerD